MHTFFPSLFYIHYSSVFNRLQDLVLIYGAPTACKARLKISVVGQEQQRYEGRG